MLLNHDRAREGAWALYSFHAFTGALAHTVIHDDGTLQDDDIALLRSLFAPLTIWRRSDADAVCTAHLSRLGLHQLSRLRQGFVFGRKLVDPVLLGHSRSIVILDSDILFFDPPDVLTDAALRGQAMYSVDTEDTYCLTDEEMRSLVGRAPVHRCNAGLLTVDRTLVDLPRWESYLASPKFWNPDGTGEYYAEQTLWALELSRLEARPLPATYAICPPSPGEVCCGHYHRATMSGYAMFYTRGLPYLRRRLRI